MGYHLQGQNRGMGLPQPFLAHIRRLDSRVVEFGVRGKTDWCGRRLPYHL